MYGLNPILFGYSVKRIRRMNVASGQKKKEQYMPIAKKTYWHLYSLQNLESEKLAETVNKILKREYVLVK